MGNLLKEALKALCGVNQWCYAVFWKIGIQNPKLLIWEESHTQATSNIPRFPENEKTEIAYFHDYANLDEMGSNAQTNDKVRSLVNKMMMDNHINIVGEGLVGRVAFTGQHQWILTENLYRETHPPELLKELCQQFSAGVQTVVVVPVLPHGVVQFGSFMTITEEKGFIDDVRSMFHKLGHGHEGLLAENYVTKELLPESNMVNSNLESPSSRTSHLKPIDEMKFDFSHLLHQSKSGITKAELFGPSNLELQMNHRSASHHITGAPSSSSSSLVLPSTNGQNHFITSNMPGGILMSELGKTNGLSLKNEAASTCNDHHEMGYSFKQRHELSACKVEKREQSITTAQHNEHQHLSPNNELVTDYSYYYTDDAYATPPSGDDLFDVLGADFKNKLFGGCNNNTLSNTSDSCLYNWDQHVSPCNKNMASSSSSDLHSLTQTNSDSTVFAFNKAEHLLDAVIRSVPSTNTNFDENVASHKTTMPSASSLPYGVFEELNAQKPMLMKAETSSVCSFRSMSSKEETHTHDSQGSSICGSSQLSSWTINGEKGRKAKQSNSASTGYSKKSEETSKSNRKRLKPGENPRPRPKDRQMIQDRVKELREIVPNGAKCSIDALLERTIKHMLFLESVTKHADKLKQTGDSKILSKDGGLLLKDNIGGATWAYEVGSQSMVCPIIVEDLNQPRQMLVEMLCEERGLFLEIADIIRGMGLTILKGVMETRSDKIWARFAVEANRDVTRMEIFISLVRLLEQSAKTGLAQGNSTVVSGDRTDT